MATPNSTTVPSADGDLKVSAADIKFFTILFKYLPRQLDIKWEDFAKEMGLKNQNVAKVRLGQIRKKLGIDGVGDSPVKPRAARPNPGKVTKKPRATKSKLSKSALEAVADAIYHSGDEKSDDGFA
ncbi:hypothetical protein F5Y08DRAFT_302765 [Xylaria arbuscula]|nr:hypothetical protein F5Y08DRAFT_302765 [Xylaria arbuscula]